MKKAKRRTLQIQMEKFGCTADEIMDATIGDYEDAIRGLEAENAQLKAELTEVRSLYEAGKAAWNPVYEAVLNERDQLKAELAQAKAREARLRRVARGLYALVKGECPSLLNEDSGGNAALDLEITEALEEAGT